MDSKDKLQLFSIFYDERAPIPSILEQHISNLRKPRQTSSPNAKQIQEMAPVARSRSEQGGIDIMEETLLLAPASKGGMPYVERAAKANLSTHFLPPATSFVAESVRLEMPQPDHCFGYIPSKKARPARLRAPFTIEEENIMNRFTLTTELYFPFFTAQWKSPAKGQTHDQAIPQGARDGCAVVNYLHQFYATARPNQVPSLIEACHFSATIDRRSIILWVHWREQDENGNVSYHMEQIESGMLDKEKDNKEIRTILRNLQDYALEDRLQGIKELLPSLWNCLAKPRPALTVSVMSSSSGMENVPALPPPTPSSDAMEPVRKRKREEG
jgi:hypothetical protein